MNQKQAPFQEVHPILKIVFYIFILMFSAAIFTLSGMYFSAFLFNIPIEEIGDLSSVAKNVDALILMQIISAFGTFIIPAIIYSKLFENKPLVFFKLNKTIKLKTIVFTIAIFFLANFVLDILVKTMHLIPFESFNNPLIDGLLQAEIDNERTLKQFLDFTSPIKFIAIFFMMAVLPGFGEELTFRGVFMNLFEKASNNTIVAIIMSGFIFAVIHVQLHNFLAIFFMGIMLGTIYYLTKNLWVSIIAHLFNNGLIVVMSYLNNIGLLTFDFSKTDDMPLIVSIFGSLIFFIAFYLYRKFLLNENLVNE